MSHTTGYDMSVLKSDYTSVERFARVLMRFAGCRIVLAHGGGHREWDKVCNLLGDKKCYYDIAFVLEEMKVSERAREHYVTHEDFFLFGTDSPWREQTRYVELIRNSDFLNQEQKEKLFFKNVSRLLRIPQKHRRQE